MARKADILRTCALTRAEKPGRELVRFAVSPEGALVPDIDGIAEGRGVWISLSAEAVEQAVRKKVFTRSLKTAVEVPPDLAQQTRSRLEQRLEGALGLARKAGQLVLGATKVKALVAQGGAVALFTATDAAPDGRRKMMQALGRADRAPLHFELLSSDRMSLALGQENVIHAALASGAAANSVVERAQRLAGFIATDRKEDDTL